MATNCSVFHSYFAFVIILNQYTVSFQVACKDPVIDSVGVTEGDNVVLNVSISTDYYKGSILLWKKGNEELTRCTAPCDGTHWQRGNSRAYGEIDFHSGNQLVVLNFTKIEYTDGGLYSLEVQHQSSICKRLETNITVHVSVPSDPICETTYMMENHNVRFTCKWNSTFDYKAEILSINQTTHRTRSTMDHETNVTSYHDNAIHLDLTLNEIFSEYSPPVICIITRFGRNRDCVFPPLFMSPKSTKIENNSASLECCTGQETLGGLWLYTSRSNTFLKIGYSLGQSVKTTVPINISADTEVIVLCGKENNNVLLSFELGKIAFSSNFYQNFRLIAIRFQTTSSNDSTKVRRNSFMIDVFAFPLESATGETFDTTDRTTLSHPSSFPKPSLSIVRDDVMFLSSEMYMLLLVKSAFVLSLITFVLCIRK